MEFRAVTRRPGIQQERIVASVLHTTKGCENGGQPEERDVINIVDGEAHNRWSIAMKSQQKRNCFYLYQKKKEDAKSVGWPQSSK